MSCQYAIGLDVVSNTISRLTEELNPVFDQIEDVINKSSFKVSDIDWEKGTIYPFASEKDFKPKKAYYDELKPEIELKYKIAFSKSVGRKKAEFSTRFGYMMENGQNTIYFQLFEEGERAKYINDSFAESVKPLLSEKWMFGYGDDSVWIEFLVDETLSVEKIHALSEDFISIILKKLLNEQ